MTEVNWSDPTGPSQPPPLPGKGEAVVRVNVSEPEGTRDEEGVGQESVGPVHRPDRKRPTELSAQDVRTLGVTEGWTPPTLPFRGGRVPLGRRHLI